MTGKLNGKITLVTGGSSGIGAATALAFAREGAKVVVASRSEVKGNKIVHHIQETGGEAIFIKTDISKASEVEALIDKTESVYGHLDCAFNNAGSSIPMRPLTDVNEEEVDRLMNVNFKGTWLCLKHEIMSMQKNGGGTIVNNASNLADVGLPGASIYSGTKGGIISLSRVAAVENAESGIRINTVSPGAVETDLLNEVVPGDIRPQMGSAYPLGRIGKPEEIAEAVIWLCSDAASFMVGHNLLIEGGYNAQ